jgi:hypothetical protein
LIVPAPYDTLDGTLTLLKAIMAENPDDRLRELFESMTIVYLLAKRKIEELEDRVEDLEENAQ